MRRIVLVLALIVSGCATPPPRPVAVPTISAPMRPLGLERVLGSTAADLVALFGKPDQDVREPGARRLQFQGPICILDTYLYAPTENAEPKVSYVDARQPDGQDIDRASCVAATARRTETR